MTTKEKIINVMFIAIIILLAAVPQLGYIQIPFLPISITLIFIPVLIGSGLYGIKTGLILGLTFGLSSMIVAFVRPTTPIDVVFQNPIISVLPRVILPIVFIYSAKLFDKISPKMVTIIIFIISILTIIISLAFEVQYGIISGLILMGLGGIILFTKRFSSKNLEKTDYILPTILSIFIHGILVLSLINLFNPDIFGDNSFIIISSVIVTNTVLEIVVSAFIIQLVLPRVRNAIHD